MRVVDTHWLSSTPTILEETSPRGFMVTAFQQSSFIGGSEGGDDQRFAVRTQMDNIVYMINKKSPLLTQTTSDAQEGVIVPYSIHPTISTHLPE